MVTAVDGVGDVNQGCGFGTSDSSQFLAKKGDSPPSDIPRSDASILTGTSGPVQPFASISEHNVVNQQSSCSTPSTTASHFPTTDGKGTYIKSSV